MKACFLILTAIYSACGTPPSAALADLDPLIDYQTKSNEFVIVVIMEQGLTEAQARQIALKRAGELTLESKNRYFSIESEERTQVMRSPGSWPSAQDFGTNMYQEKIVEKDFGKETLQRQTPTAEAVAAMRYTIETYPEKPRKKAYDACHYTKCE